MPIVVSPTSPVRVKAQGTAITTAAFTPPAGSLLVACVHADPARTFTISNNGAALTWNLIRQQGSGSGVAYVGAWWAALDASRSLTVTSTGSVSDDQSLKVYVLTGAATAVPVVGGTNGGTATTNTLTTAGFTVAADGSLGFVVADDFVANPGTTSPDTTFDAGDTAGEMVGGSGYKPLGAAGSSATFTVDAGGTSTAAWQWISFEVREAAASAAAAKKFIPPNRARFRAATW